MAHFFVLFADHINFLRGPSKCLLQRKDSIDLGEEFDIHSRKFSNYSQRAGSEGQPEGGPTDVRTYGQTEVLPILQDFVRSRGRCPKIPD